jgi:hypothetical protein
LTAAVAAVLAMASAACGSGAPSASPSTRTISRQPVVSAPSTTAPAPATSSPAPATSSPAATPSPAITPPPPAGSGLRGRTVVLNCPVDRADPPCPAIPVQARVVVLNKTGQTTRATVDTDADGWFTVALPPGSYQIRAAGTGGSLARRPAIQQVTVAAGSYTTVTLRLITGLR